MRNYFIVYVSTWMYTHFMLPYSKRFSFPKSRHYCIKFQFNKWNLSVIMKLFSCWKNRNRSQKPIYLNLIFFFISRVVLRMHNQFICLDFLYYRLNMYNSRIIHPFLEKKAELKSNFVRFGVWIINWHGAGWSIRLSNFSLTPALHNTLTPTQISVIVITFILH